MNRKKEKFTHMAKIFGILSFYNIDTKSFKGVNVIYDLSIDVIIWLGILLDIDDEEPLKFKIIRELKENEQYH